MKKIINLALIGAAIAGVVYLLKDKEWIENWIGKAGDAASEDLVSASDGFSTVRDRSSNALSEIV